MAKNPTNWSSNISVEANLLTYDTFAATYDSATATYDNIVVGDVADSDKVPAVWTGA